MKKILFALLILIVGMSNCFALECNSSVYLGSKGDSVKEVQKYLNANQKCNLDIDGIFGLKTEKCVKEYQEKNNLEVDGIVGPITCNYLIGNPTIKEYKNNRNSFGIVTGDIVNIRKAPTTKSTILSKTGAGRIYQILNYENNWYKIKYSNTKEGYISGDYFINDFIVVDKTNQKFYYYKSGKLLWSTNIVTGMRGSHDTPNGVYKLNKAYFVTNTTLSGYNDDGSKYNAPVDYWMPFIFASGIGFHDATWRNYNEFNKNEYLTNGSHGCVNMYHEAAEKLYNEDFKIISVIVKD